MLTFRARNDDAPRIGDRLSVWRGSGLVAFAASTTVSYIRLRGRRRAGRTEVVAPAVTCVESGSPSADGHPQRETPPPARIEDATPGPSNAAHKRSAYGVGFDQHSAHNRGRPIAWVVVAVITAGTCVGGASLILSAPWLFWTGVGVVVAGIVVGRATHAMRDELAPLPSELRGQPIDGQKQPSGMAP